MSEHHTVSREGLQAEAQLLAALIEQYRKDVHAFRTNTRFIYFVDAHELKSFLSGNEGDMLGGFVFDVERALGEQQNSKIVIENVRLKAEQIHRRLLFEGTHRLLLLPSHAEEMDEQTAFVAWTTLTRNYDLAGIARRQLAALRKEGVDRDKLAEMAVAANEGDKKSKDLLLRVLANRVPALVELLFPAPGSAPARLDALLSRSNVSLLQDAKWQEMGFNDEQSARLDACVPSIEDLTHWTRRLNSGRRNTLQSNRRDASALAHLEVLNRCFEAMGVDAKACLVTRAVTLLKAMRSTRGSEAYLRHSRLVATATESKSPDISVGGPALDALQFALELYEKRLSMPQSAQGLTLAPEAEANELLTAWNAFEDARLTLDLAQDSPSTAPAPTGEAEAQWNALVRWLQSDDDVVDIVERSLQQQVGHFRAAMVIRDAQGMSGTPVWVSDPLPDSRVRQVKSIEVNGLGPLYLPERLFDGKGALALRYDPEALDVSEELLALSFFQACRKRWPLAHFYVRLAIQSADMMALPMVAHQAKLLLAQLFRAGDASSADETDHPARTDRFGKATELLRGPGGRRDKDPRYEVEWWALQLERLVDIRRSGAGAGTAQELAHGVKTLFQMLAVDGAAVELRVRIQELILAYVMVGLRKWRDANVVNEPMLLEVTTAAIESHRGLVKDMDEWRRGHGIDELPQFTRAIELLGYDILRRLSVLFAEAEDSSPPQIPAPLLFDLYALQAQLTRHPDEVSKMVGSELVKLIDLTRGRREFLVVYAPVSDRAEDLVLINTLPEPAAREAAVRACGIVHELGNSQLFLEGEELVSQQVEEGRKLIRQALSAQGLRDDLRTHLDSELAYLTLLEALAFKDEAEKRQALVKVADIYEDLVRRYPGSAILHYRQSIVLDDLEKFEAAFEALNRVISLMATDTRISHDHWFRSVVRRRLAFWFSSKATEMRNRLKDTNDEGARQQYLEHMAQAFQMVNDGSSPGRQVATYVERIEARRRLNNQVYYAALYGSGGGKLESLPNFGRERLLDLTRLLISDGEIKDIPELNVAHTVGLAFSTVGEIRLAAQAGERVLQLIARRGDQAGSESISAILNDALSWIGKFDRESAPAPLA